MRTKRKIINLFEDKNIFSIKHVVSISTEEDLNQFWGFLTSSQNNSHTLINTFITQFYNFALSYIHTKDAEFFEIIIEENLEFFYFTLWNNKISQQFKSLIEKTPLNFLHNNNKITIKLEKMAYEDKIEKLNTKRENNLIKSVTKKKAIKHIKPYTFLEESDLEDLVKLNDDLQELSYQINKYGIDDSLFISLRSSFSMFCFTLRYYEQLSPISNTVTKFSNLMNTHKENFIAFSSIELELVNGFINNLDRWFMTLFVNGGANLYFMDNSIEADFNMIHQLLIPQENCENMNLDDIFDF